MTLETRARRAAQGIRRAVEDMEMSTSTKEPRKVERFDRYRARKERNGRIAAIAAAAAMIVASIVVVGTQALDRGQGTVPGREVGNPGPGDARLTSIGTVTQSDEGCSLELTDRALTAGTRSITLVNRTERSVLFALFVLSASGSLTFEAFDAHIQEERGLAEAGEPPLGPPGGADDLTSTHGLTGERVAAGSSDEIYEVFASGGTYAVVCFRRFEGVGMRPFDLVGPIRIE